MPKEFECEKCQRVYDKQVAKDNDTALKQQQAQSQPLGRKG